MTLNSILIPLNEQHFFECSLETNLERNKTLNDDMEIDKPENSFYDFLNDFLQLKARLSLLKLHSYNRKLNPDEKNTQKPKPIISSILDIHTRLGLLNAFHKLFKSLYKLKCLNFKIKRGFYKDYTEWSINFSTTKTVNFTVRLTGLKVEYKINDYYKRIQFFSDLGFILAEFIKKQILEYIKSPDNSSIYEG